MMKRAIIYLLLPCLLVSATVFAQKRFQSEVFTTIDSLTSIQYGQAVNLKGNQENLLLDVIMPFLK